MKNLDFFKQYENNKIKREKTISTIVESFKEEGDLYIEPLTDTEEKIEQLAEIMTEFKSEIEEKILSFDYDSDAYFDSEIIKHLRVMHNYIKGFIPDYPEYYNEETGKINPQAFLDARDMMKHAIGVTPEQIIESDDNFSGVMNDNRLNFDNGLQMDEFGNIYDANLEMIFKAKDPTQKVKYIDFLNEKIITENGIRVDMPDDFITKNFIGNDEIKESIKERYEEIKNGGQDSSANEGIIGKYNDVLLGEKDELLFRMEVEDIFMGDIYGNDMNVDLVEQIKRYKTEELTFGVCNFQQIPYAKLNSLLFWGGGERGVKPLSSSEISDKDIIFKPDGTVLYSGSNSTIRVKRSGCKSKTYKTGHVAMYSKSNPIGLERGIIQYIYSFCASIGLFNANIPKLVGFKKFKIFPGLCIGGLLEQALCAWQERISKEINDMFQCKPTEMPSDLSQSGFENSLYPYGASVETLSDLDLIKSVGTMDRFVVNIVSQSVTGLKDSACGVFFYDPEGKTASVCPWIYGDWRGKPFNKESTGTIKTISENAYSNPLIQDIMSGDATGVDGITKKLMSLQYAFQKKEELLALKDIEDSIDGNLDAIIYDVLDKLSEGMAGFMHMISYEEGLSTVPGFETKSFAHQFYKHFSMLVDNGVLKDIDFNKCKRTYSYSESSSSSNDSTTVSVEYYDFSGYDHTVYLVPNRDYVKYYDQVMFAETHVPNSELLDIYNKNISILNKLGEEDDKYKKVSTIRDFINISSYKEAYEVDISDNLTFVKKDLEYEEYEEPAFEQVDKRCYYTINNKKIFNV